MAGFEEFSVSMRVRAKAVVDNTDRLVRKVALAVDQAVVVGTPVDTGRARSNWIVSLDAPAEGTVDAKVPGTGGSSGAENTTAALAQASGEIAKYNGDSHTAIHITNNLPYIERLNDGYSAQAPANFVQEAVGKAVEVFQGRVILTEEGGVK